MSIKRFNGAGLYSSKSIKVWDQVTTQNDFQSIATVIVSNGSTNTITFSGIPQTFTHLQLRGVAASSTTVGPDYLKMTINSSTTYAWHGLTSSGSATSGLTPTGTSGSTQTSFQLSSIPGIDAPITSFGSFIIDFLDYTSTVKAKTIKAIGGYDQVSSGTVGIYSGLDYSTPTKISTFTITTVNNKYFSQFSQFALYGIKVAS